MFGGKKNLSKLEHLVMDTLWKRGPSTAEDIRVALEKKHFMKESTARTFSNGSRIKDTRVTVSKGEPTSIPASRDGREWRRGQCGE